MKMQIKIKDVETKMIFFLFFIIGLNLFTISYIMIYLVFFYFIIKMRFQILDKNSIWLLIYGILACISFLITSANLTIGDVFKVFVYFALLCIGKGFGFHHQYVNQLEYRMKGILLGFAYGNFIHFGIDFCISENRNLIMQYGARTVTDIWTGSSTPATIMAGWCIPLICVAYYILTISYIKNRTKIIVSIMIVLSFIMNLYTGTRTYLMTFLLIIFIMYFLDVLYYRKKTKVIVRISILGMTTLILLIVLLINNVGGIYTKFSQTALMKRFVIGELSDNVFGGNGRMERNFMLISNIGKTIWGGGTLQYSGNALHNWILQAIDLYGIIPGIIIFAIIVKIIIYTLRVVKNMNLSTGYRILLTESVGAIIVFSMIEPVITSNNIVGGIIFLVYGLSNSKSDNNKLELRDVNNLDFITKGEGKEC